MTPSRQDFEQARYDGSQARRWQFYPLAHTFVGSPRWHMKQRIKERRAAQRAKVRGRAQMRRALMRGRREVLKRGFVAPARQLVQEVYVHEWRSSYSPWGLVVYGFAEFLRGFRPRHVDPNEIPF